MHVDDVLDHADQFERPDPPSSEAAVSLQEEKRAKLESARQRIELMHCFLFEGDDRCLDDVDREIEGMILTGVSENDIMNTRFGRS
jgi:hypothetical protein